MSSQIILQVFLFYLKETSCSAFSIYSFGILSNIKVYHLPHVHRASSFVRTVPYGNRNKRNTRARSCCEDAKAPPGPRSKAPEGTFAGTVKAAVPRETRPPRQPPEPRTPTGQHTPDSRSRPGKSRVQATARPQNRIKAKPSGHPTPPPARPARSAVPPQAAPVSHALRRGLAGTGPARHPPQLPPPRGAAGPSRGDTHPPHPPAQPRPPALPRASADPAAQLQPPLRSRQELTPATASASGSRSVRPFFYFFYPAPGTAAPGSASASPPPRQLRRRGRFRRRDSRGLPMRPEPLRLGEEQRAVASTGRSSPSGAAGVTPAPRVPLRPRSASAFSHRLLPPVSLHLSAR